jgi:hypothetical protein
MRPDQHQKHNLSRLRSNIVLLVFLGIAGFYLLTEHTAHVFGILPYLLVFLCPILHFLHGGHGGHGSQHRQEKGDER